MSLACCTSAPKAINVGSSAQLVDLARMNVKDGGAFVAVVDRALDDLRKTIVAEHVRFLSVRTPRSSASPSNDQGMPSKPLSEYDISFAQKQPTIPQKISGLDPPEVGAGKAGSKECAVQTRVDWTMALWPQVVNDKAPQERLHGSWIPPSRGSEKSNTSKEPPSRNDSGHLKTNGNKGGNVANGTGMTKQELDEIRNNKEKNFEPALSTSWKRAAYRLKKEPDTMLDFVFSFAILANATSIAISSDTKEWTEGWLLIDTVFASIFLIELCMKCWRKGILGYLFSREWHWAWFELVLVLVSIAEIAVTFIFVDIDHPQGSSLFRIIRLVRLTKMLRIFRVPMAAELDMMVKGAIGGARTLLWALVLISFPLFVVAMVFRETLGEEKGSSIDDATGAFGAASSFSTLSSAAFTTFRCVVAGDCADGSGRPIFVLVTSEYGWCYGLVYSLTLVLMQFGLFNVIIALFVEQTVEAAKSNELYQKRCRLMDNVMFKEKSLEMAELAYSLRHGVDVASVAKKPTHDEMYAMELSHEEFTNLCHDPYFKDVLSSLDVAEEDHLDLFDTLDVDGGGTLDLGEIVSGIAKLRGDAKKSDAVAAILLAKHLNRSLSDFRDETYNALEMQGQILTSLQRTMQPLSNLQA